MSQKLDAMRRQRSRVAPQRPSVVREVYDNCLVTRFDADGRCRKFTEWYTKRPSSESHE